jgi:hypothetical protein
MIRFHVQKAFLDWQHRAKGWLYLFNTSAWRESRPRSPIGPHLTGNLDEELDFN